MVNQTLLTAAEKYGHYIGDITLTLDANHRPVDPARTVLTADLPEAADEAEIAGYLAQGHAQLAAQVVADLPSTADCYRGESPMMTAGLKAIEAATQTSRCLNTGYFLGELRPGLVTKDDLQSHRIR